MFILTIRTDKPESEIGLFNDQEQLAYETWQAHRSLAETLHSKLQKLLESNNLSLESGLAGIVVYQGPGSFTGLRIGLTVANALSYSNNVPVVAVKGSETESQNNISWRQEGIRELVKVHAAQKDKHIGKQKDKQEGKKVQSNIVMPFYGADVHITLPKR